MSNSTMESIIYAQEEVAYDTPEDFFVNSRFIGPTIMDFGSEDPAMF